MEELKLDAELTSDCDDPAEGLCVDVLPPPQAVSKKVSQEKIKPNLHRCNVIYEYPS